MRIGIFGDLQLTNKSPERRLDDYWKTLIGKVAQGLEIFEDAKCDCVLQVGDFFDAPTAARRVSSEITHLLYTWTREENPVFCVFGQHDVIGHSKSTLPNSPLADLQAARIVKVLSDNPVYLGSEEEIFCLYGASFGEPIPVPNEGDYYNILVTHRMIGSKPLWPDQVLEGPRQFLRKYPCYNLVVCGDYHFRFIETWNGRTIINPGAIVRKTISEFDLEHRPAVVIFDTDTSKVEVVELKFESIEKIFNLVRVVERPDSQVLIDLVEKLKKGGRKLSGWKHFLVKILNERNAREGVRNVIDQHLEKVTNG